MQKSSKVLTAGTFDGLHVGHQWVLNAAAARTNGGILHVIIAPDTTVTHTKGRPPRHPQAARKAAVEAYLTQSNIAHVVHIGHENSPPTVLLCEIKPDIVALGYDQTIDEKALIDALPGLIVWRMPPYAAKHFKSSRFSGTL